MKKSLHPLIFVFGLLLLPIQMFACEVIGELPEECHLLRTLHTLPNQEIERLAPEYYLIGTQLKERIIALMKGQIYEKTNLHEELTPEEGLKIFGPCLGIDHYLTNPAVRTVFSESFSPEFYFVRHSKKAPIEPENYFTETELQEIYQVAQEILKLTSYGDRLISLGQSPAYIVEALEELGSIDESLFRGITKVPFSGAADYSCLNSHYKCLHLSNVITPESLSYYKKILTDKGISPLQLGSTGKIYLIDLIGTGGSISSFLKLLIQWYKASNMRLPDFKLLDLSVENRHFKNQNQAILPLTDHCQIHIERCFIHTSAHLSDKLDYTEGEDRIIPPFSPLQWKPEYEKVYHRYPNTYGQKVIKCVRDYARHQYQVGK